MKLRCELVAIHFQNAEFWSVASMRPLEGEHTGEEHKATGYLPGIAPGAILDLVGEWGQHPKYGEQFKFERADEVQPTGAAGLVRFLRAHLPGVGEKRAQELIDKFGEADLFDRLDGLRADELAAQFPWMSVGGALAIQKALRATRTERDTLVYLRGLELTDLQIARLKKTYGAEVRRVLTEEPYRIVDEVEGFGFTTVDKLAQRAGLPHNSEDRARAGFLYLLKAEEQKRGDCYQETYPFVRHVADQLTIPDELVEQAMQALVDAERVTIEGERVYRRRIYWQEKQVAACIGALLEAVDGPAAPLDVVDVTTQGGLTLDEHQQEAIRLVCANPVAVITGGPGTGKTTVCRAVLDRLQAAGIEVACAAPTGKAAKRLSEQTGRPASTIHRLLAWSPALKKFRHDDTNPLPVGAVLIDETSMVDIALMSHLTRALKRGTRLILVGDADQLPSIGPGMVLRDVIRSKTVPVARLQQVHRQSEKSWIGVNAQRILAGQMPRLTSNPKESEDFFWVEAEDAEAAAEAVVRLAVRTLPRGFGMDPLRDVQVLCPQRPGPVGMNALNEELQRELNPADAGKQEVPLKGRVLREGDRVRQTKNNYDLGVYNGETGIIAGLRDKGQFVQVDFGDRVVEYPKAMAAELQLCYASTIHSSQGSEYQAVVVVVHSANYYMLSRPLIYTAVTRGKKVVFLVGNQRGLQAAVSKAEVVARNTTLAKRLQAGVQGFREDAMRAALGAVKETGDGERGAGEAGPGSAGADGGGGHGDEPGGAGGGDPAPAAGEGVSGGGESDGFGDAGADGTAAAAAAGVQGALFG